MMTTCIDDTNESQLCFFIGRSAVIVYLVLFYLMLEDVILEIAPIERTEQDL